jgi:putative transposase
LQVAAERHGCATHAYVLMTNHTHLLATPETESSLPKTMQSVGRRYVQYFNFTYSRTGTLWEGRYKATIIDSEAYLLTCMRYIELNPVRAGMVKNPSDYPWSSYGVNALGVHDKLCISHSLYERIGRNADERQAGYRKLFRKQVSEIELDAIREATNKAWALGNDGFREKIEALAGRRTTPRPRGRPKKGLD